MKRAETGADHLLLFRGPICQRVSFGKSGLGQGLLAKPVEITWGLPHMKGPRAMSKSAAQRSPSGLSRRSRALWTELHSANDFAAHEDDQLERALRWYDVADRLLHEAEKLDGRERAARLKAAGDAATTGLRHWRTLKFTDPAKPARRSERPSGKSWAQMRADMLRRLPDANR